MENKIKWQTGEPNKQGAYLVLLRNNIVRYDFFGWWDNEPWKWKIYSENNIIAWCNISDIEPYKK